MAYPGSCSRHISAAMSQAYHMWCWCVGGSCGKLTGLHAAARMMRSASRKLRNRDATSKSCRAQLGREAQMHCTRQADCQQVSLGPSCSHATQTIPAQPTLVGGWGQRQAELATQMNQAIRGKLQCPLTQEQRSRQPGCHAGSQHPAQKSNAPFWAHSKAGTVLCSSILH